MDDRLLICTDLDRTLLPNGSEPESSGSRELFFRLASDPSVRLAYVSGRHRQLVIDAIQNYQLPLPDWVIADVGSKIYKVNQDNWEYWPGWEKQIAADWHGFKSADVQPLFEDLKELKLQESEKQHAYKLSYYTPLDIDFPQLEAKMQERLEQRELSSSIIFSVDEAASVGLLDILPLRANKLDAIEYLMISHKFDYENTIFAGDSGNDLLVLTSAISSILVANAHQDVIQQAYAVASERGTLDSLYLAKGTFKGMNGNYSAGILEGLHHFHPHLAIWNSL